MMAEQIQRTRRRLHVALVYNGDRECAPDRPEDRGGTADLRSMIRHMAIALRRVGYKVTVVPLARNLSPSSGNCGGWPPTSFSTSTTTWCMGPCTKCGCRPWCG